MRVHELSMPIPMPSGKPARPAHHAGWAARLIAGAIVMSIALVMVVPFELNRPWVKGRLEALVRSSIGLDLEYGAIRLRWLSGFEVDDLVLRSAPEQRSFAPDLARARRVGLYWGASSLLARSPRIERIAVTDVTVAVVVDEHGRTSFDGIGWVWPHVPLSRRSGQLLASIPSVARLDIARADITVIRTRGGRVVERDRVRGFEATLTAERDPGELRLHAVAGSNHAPLDLDVRREGDSVPPEAARAGFSLAADLTASALSVSCDLRALTQSFLPSIEPADWHAEAVARFEPPVGRTTIALDRVSAAGFGTVEARLEVPDEGGPIVRQAQGDVDVTRLLALLPARLPVIAERARLHYRVDSAVLGRLPRFTEGGGVRIDVDVPSVKAMAPAGVIDVRGGATRARRTAGRRRGAHGASGPPLRDSRCAFPGKPRIRRLGRSRGARSARRPRPLRR